MNIPKKITLKLWNKLSVRANKKNIIVGFIIIVLFNLLLLPGFPKLFSVKNSYPLDLKFGYTSYEAYSLLNQLNQHGRKIYLLSELLIDLPYAVLYSLIYSIIIIALFNNSKIKFHKYFLWFPFLIGFFDIIENLSISLMILFYSHKLKYLGSFAGTVTLLKWIFAAITFCIVLIGLIKLLLRKKQQNIQML